MGVMRRAVAIRVLVALIPFIVSQKIGAQDQSIDLDKESPRGVGVIGVPDDPPVPPESVLPDAYDIGDGSVRGRQDYDMTDEFMPAAGDSDVLARVGDTELTRGNVRRLAALLQRQEPNLAAGEAFNRALFIAAVDFVLAADAEKRGLTAPIEAAIRFRDKQREFCPLSTECIEVVNAQLIALGLTEEEYWDARRYQRFLTIDHLKQKVIEENGWTGKDPATRSRLLQEWERQLLEEAPIHWLDPDIERELPDIIANMKPIISQTETFEPSP